MHLALLAGAMVALLALGYRFYGRFIARQFALQAGAQTPSHRHADGVDFVPTRPFYLFGQHFSAIAAAGPIVGPILACQQYGWLPCVLWIGFGVIFIGAVHDVATLVASVRHDGKSIAEVLRVHVGRPAWLMMSTFIWVALVYVIVAFTDVTASTFVTGDAETKDLMRFNQGGAVALAALLYLGLAMVMGIIERFLKWPLWLLTIIFVPATVGCIWVGTQYSTLLILPWQAWIFVLLGYCALASVAPVWLLMQPRGYLGGFVLYAALLIGVIGIFFGGHSIEQPAFRGFSASGGSLFPFLFVTIACGACSGFHGLVCSGTTSKQIDKETHCHPVGYGAMLLEAFVALIALATVMIVATSTDKPGALYAKGIGTFLTQIIGPEHRTMAITFGAMALSTFIFDTLDSATRLGRYLLQEVFAAPSRLAAVGATLLTCAVPLVFLLMAGQGAYALFWKLFGTSNQLLAALSLLAITLWLRREGRRYWFTLAPCLFVASITLTSLVLQIRELAAATLGSPAWINAVVALVLAGLAIAIGVLGVRAWRQPALPVTVSHG
ncbi:MAG: carbon starvation protein A [Myxococcales bacterium]|nr:carbon starvation protein A [Myxococcales bacterium]